MHGKICAATGKKDINIVFFKLLFAFYTGSDSGSEPCSDSGSDSVSDTGSDPGSDCDPDCGSDSASVSASDCGSEFGSESGSDSGSHPGLNPVLFRCHSSGPLASSPYPASVSFPFILRARTRLHNNTPATRRVDTVPRKNQDEAPRQRRRDEGRENKQQHFQ
jgi:hypothetical protein